MTDDSTFQAAKIGDITVNRRAWEAGSPYNLPSQYVALAPANPSTANVVLAILRFQEGPVRLRGRNGVTEEALIAVLIDRMEHHQRGQYASSDNAEALQALKAARNALARRTASRTARGVEGTYAR